jgi:hypothetical protein
MSPETIQGKKNRDKNPKEAIQKNVPSPTC